MSSIEEDFEEGLWPFGGEGDAAEPSDADEVLIPSGASCAKISEFLSTADNKAGEYSFGGLADILPVAPGLIIDGVGAISFPLVPKQAEELIAKCENSPFGNNQDTEMDKNVRKSWQLAPDQMKISNAQWQVGIEELTKTIAQRLGYEKIPMQCALKNMLMYGEGRGVAVLRGYRGGDGVSSSTSGSIASNTSTSTNTSTNTSYATDASAPLFTDPPTPAVPPTLAPPLTVAPSPALPLTLPFARRRAPTVSPSPARPPTPASA